MRTIEMRRKSHFVGMLILAAALPSMLGAAPADATGKEKGGRAESRDPASKTLRPIRVAVLEIDVLDGVGVEGAVIADRLDAMLSRIPRVTVLNRRQIEKVAEEHQIALSGLAEGSSAARLGRFLSARYILLGRASKVDGKLNLALKIVDVETTVQTAISAKAGTDDGFEAVLEQANASLTAKVRRLQRARTQEGDGTLAELRRCAKPLSGKRVLVAVEETHVDRPLRDPAAQTALMKRLRKLGMSVIAPAAPEEGWKKTLLQHREIRFTRRGYPPRRGRNQRLRGEDRRVGQLPCPRRTPRDSPPGRRNRRRRPRCGGRRRSG